MIDNIFLPIEKSTDNAIVGFGERVYNQAVSIVNLGSVFIAKKENIESDIESVSTSIRFDGNKIVMDKSNEKLSVFNQSTEYSGIFLQWVIDPEVIDLFIGTVSISQPFSTSTSRS